MSRRIEIELTSNKGDGTWTWRAAGAREPRGLISAEMIPKGAGINSVFTAEVQSDMDGIVVLAVIESEDTRMAPETIEVLGTGKRSAGVNFKGGGRGRRQSRGESFGSGGFGGDGFRQDQSKRKQQSGRRKGRSQGTGQDRPARLRPARVHRKKWLASVPPEHAALAEQIASGRGIANEKGGASEKSSASENGSAPENSSASEQNSVSEDSSVAVKGSASEKNETAEKSSASEKGAASGKVSVADKDVSARLLSEYRMAEWQDRADLVLSNFEKIDLAEIRTLVADADAHARTSETRSQAEEARQKLAERTERQHGEWLADLATHLSEGRVLRALRLSGQPPKTGVPLPLDLVKWLTTATADILTPEAQPDRWEKTLQALAVSPVRRLVRPEHPPAIVSPELTEAVKELSPRFPHIAALFIDEADAEAGEEEASEEPEEADTEESEAARAAETEAMGTEAATDSEKPMDSSDEEQQEQSPETEAAESETAEAETAETPEAEEPAT